MAASLDLEHLDGIVGFRIDGIGFLNNSGAAVHGAGDFNGDGVDDLVIGAPFASGDSFLGAGETYIVYGSTAGFAPSLDLSSLDGSNGFRIDGIGFLSNSGFSVSGAGDVNGDGLSDVVIGAPFADGNGATASGETYVIFGSTTGYGPSLSVSSLDGTNGFQVDGIDLFDTAGFSVSGAGDVNGDGVDDFVIGAPFAGGDSGVASGESYVVFGSTGGFPANLDLSSLDGTNGFRIDGADPVDLAGFSVSDAGDVNGDGLDDIIIGAPLEGGLAGLLSGEGYVVFGSTGGFSPSLDLDSLDGTNGFRINGFSLLETVGFSVSGAGDINGDGVDDVILGGPIAKANGEPAAGVTYVVFGSSDPFGPSVDLFALDGTNGFRIEGVEGADLSGFSVSDAGDVNGDGVDDIVIGAPSIDILGGDRSGEVFVVYGSTGGFGPSLDLGDLNGGNGFRLNGVDLKDHAGISVAGAGDVNHDGYDDVIVGARFANGNEILDAGESYVVFGREANEIPDANDDHISVSEDAVHHIVTGELLANDTDAEGDPLTIIEVDDSGAQFMTVTLDGTDVKVTPGPAYNSLAVGETATETFSYTVSDHPGSVWDCEDTATVTVTIVGVNDDPVALSDNSGIYEDDGPLDLTHDLLANDSDVDASDTLKMVSIDDTGVKGLLSLDAATGRVAYDPNGAFNHLAEGETATDTFTYTISDGNGGFATATSTVTVHGQNDAPTAHADHFTFGENDGANYITSFVLANDVDPDATDTLQIVSIDDTGTKGLVQLKDGKLIYDPNGQFENHQSGDAESDSFTYTVADQWGVMSTTTVNITIVGENDVPDAQNAGSGFHEDQAPTDITADILKNDFDIDGDALMVTEIDASGVDGLLTLTNGQVVFSPNGAYEYLAEGEMITQTYTYTVSDGAGGEDTAVGKLFIEGRNDDPSALGDAVQVHENDGPVNVTASLLANDADVDLTDTLSIVSIDASGALGSVSLQNGQVTYNANGQFEGLAAGETATETFSYTVDDGNGGQSTATVHVTVVGENDAPTAASDEATARQGETIIIPQAELLANDADVDGDMLSVSSVGAAKNGSVMMLANGDIVFTPAPGFTGDAGFDYTISDGKGGVATASVAVTVTALNATMIGTANADVLSGGAAADDIHGLGGDDELFGHAGADNLRGQGGHDSLYGAAGADFLLGEAGDDALYGGDGDAAADTLMGGGGGDLLVGGGGDDLLDGGDAGDKLSGDAGNDTLLGGWGVDSLLGGDGDDYLSGGGANDALYGNGGADTLDGGAGDDLFVAQGGADWGLGGDGADTLYGGESDAASDTLEGGAGDDLILGFDGADVLLGQDGADKIDGGEGDDTIEGGAGNDTLFGRTGNDILDGGAGDDQLSGNQDSDTLLGGEGNDSLYAQFGDDFVDGGAGDDEIYGGGDSGADTLKGGAGNDILFGFGGGDVFIFGAGDGLDEIRDYEAGIDSLDLSGLGADFDTMAEVMAVASQQGSAVVFDFGADELTLSNTQLTDLGAWDFTFA